MFAALGDTGESITAAIAFLLPGFLAISTYEAFSPSIARDRSIWHWTMWSLIVSLVLVAAMHGLYWSLGLPRDTTDPEFYIGLFAVAIVGGYGTGRLTATSTARDVASRLKMLQPRWIWFEVMSKPGRYVVVHLTDGSVLYGFPIKYTDDSREDVKEILLASPSLLIKGEDGEPDKWEPYPNTEGVLLESTQIKLIQLLEDERPLDSA